MYTSTQRYSSHHLSLPFKQLPRLKVLTYLGNGRQRNIEKYIEYLQILETPNLMYDLVF
jgi:hypothetical protein